MKLQDLKRGKSVKLEHSDLPVRFRAYVNHPFVIKSINLDTRRVKIEGHVALDMSISEAVKYLALCPLKYICKNT